MRTLKFIIPAALLLFWAASCTPHQEHNAQQAAIVARLTESHPGLSDFIFTDYEVTETVTLGEAIDDCIDIHQAKVQISEKRASQFRAARKRRNAARCDSVAQTAQAVVVKLHALKTSMLPSLDSVLYCCVRFSSQTFAKDDTFRVDNYFVTVDTENNILNMQPNAGGLHNGMGRLIPGYIDILLGTEEEDE